jgi:hypothetical protein
LKLISKVKRNKTQGVHFLWFKWKENKSYAIHWECQPPVWWLPKVERDELGWRAGWLVFAFGFCNQPVTLED